MWLDHTMTMEIGPYGNDDIPVSSGPAPGSVITADDGVAARIIDGDAMLTGNSMYNSDILPAGMDVPEFLQATSFWDAGYTASGINVGNIEGGHVWGPRAAGTGNWTGSTEGGHNALGNVEAYVQSAGAANVYRRHATSVANVIGGSPIGDEEARGIAPDADIWSGDIAVSHGSGSSFSISVNSYYEPYQAMLRDGIDTGNGPEIVDVINSSFGYTDNTASESTLSFIVDGMVFQSNRPVVVSSGNNGPGANKVTHPASGFNVISVGSVGNFANSTYDELAESSSGGPQDMFIPVNGADIDGDEGATDDAKRIAGARVAVDLVAPGGPFSQIQLADLGGPDSYSGISGTSFAAPAVAGGIALSLDAIRNTASGDGLIEGEDGRVLASIIMNSTDKLAGWDNGQVQGLDGVIRTDQALDYYMGTGRMNLDTALLQATGGTQGVDGVGSGDVEAIGWDAGLTVAGAPTEYTIAEQLLEGTSFSVTLNWYMDRFLSTDGTQVGHRSFDNLDLEFWRMDSNGNFLDLVGESTSLYNTSEHLYLTIQETGYYGIKVIWEEEHWDFYSGGDLDIAFYGLAWLGTAAPASDPQGVPLPATAALLGLGAVLARRR